jgi:acyl-coenzyme A thioesterase PaaI-like protein
LHASRLRLQWIHPPALSPAAANFQAFICRVALAALCWNSIYGGKGVGCWHTRKASADLSIFPGAWIAGPVNLPSRAGTFFLVNWRPAPVHALFPVVTFSVHLLIYANMAQTDSQAAIIPYYNGAGDETVMTTKQPNSRHCFVCGVENSIGLKLKFYNTAPGEVTSEINIPTQYQSYPGIVHGGIVAAMLDEAAGRSQMGDGDDTRFMFTGTLKIRYLKNVPVEEPLRLVGRATENRGRVAQAVSAIYNQEGTLLAEANAVLVNVPEDIVGSVDLDALGWAVYPD